jgi:hypothetical protein
MSEVLMSEEACARFVSWCSIRVKPYTRLAKFADAGGEHAGDAHGGGDMGLRKGILAPAAVVALVLMAIARRMLMLVRTSSLTSSVQAQRGWDIKESR